MPLLETRFAPKIPKRAETHSNRKAARNANFLVASGLRERRGHARSRRAALAGRRPWAPGAWIRAQVTAD